MKISHPPADRTSKAFLKHAAMLAAAVMLGLPIFLSVAQPTPGDVRAADPVFGDPTTGAGSLATRNNMHLAALERAEVVFQRARNVARRAGDNPAEYVRYFTAEYRVAMSVLADLPADDIGSELREPSRTIPTLTPFDEEVLRQLEDTEYVDNFAELVEAPDSPGTAFRRAFIRDGTEVREKGFPEVVAVGRHPSDFECSGILLSPHIVLTAGHCGPKNKPAWIYVGNDASSLPDLEDDPTADYRHLGVYRTTSAPIKHTNFRRTLSAFGERIENDLMLYFLPNPVQGELPEVRFAPAQMFNDNLKYVRAVGFGADDPGDRFGFGVKRRGDLLITLRSCDAASTHTWGCNPPYEFVAGLHLARDKYQSLCSGDSGAPVFIEAANGDFYLAGINSRATNGKQLQSEACGVPSIITRVDFFLESWIKPELQTLVEEGRLAATAIPPLQWAQGAVAGSGDDGIPGVPVITPEPDDGP